MPSETFWRTSEYLRLTPGLVLSVKYVKIFQVFIARVASEKIKFSSHYSHSMSIPCHWADSRIYSFLPTRDIVWQALPEGLVPEIFGLVQIILVVFRM